MSSALFALSDFYPECPKERALGRNKGNWVGKPHFSEIILYFDCFSLGRVVTKIKRRVFATRRWVELN